MRDRLRPARALRTGRRRGAVRLKGLGRIGMAVAALLLIPSLADLALMARPATNGCRIVKIIDGDTATLACPGEGVFAARLLGFDTPEVFSPGCPAEWAAGQAATFHLRRLVWGARTREIGHHGTDRYGRRLVHLRLDGVPAAQSMIAAGHARAYDGGWRDGWCA